MKKSDLIDLLPDEEIIINEDGFIMTMRDFGDGDAAYTVYDEVGNFMNDFDGDTLTDEDRKDITKTEVYKKFIDIVDKGYVDFDFSGDGDGYSSVDDDFYRNGSLDKYTPRLSDDTDWYSSRKTKTPKQIADEKELVESLCKSDTIVFHRDDPTTVMLRPIYEGKNWDVFTGDKYSGELSRDSINELIKRHDKIICLGHGSPYGLFGGIVDRNADKELFKGKKIFALWCYAATFWKDWGFSGTGILCSDNAPSEVWECKAACGADVSAEWIYDNITYWGECLADVVELSWTDPEKACKIAKENYYKSYKDCQTDDERKVVEFNTNTIQVV